jgi:anaerobic nitric oxide reductase transcription regulator
MIQTLLQMALDLTAAVTADDRYRRLVAATRRIVPCDAATLLHLRGGSLVILAADGLLPESQGYRFRPTEHPRLSRILAARRVVRFDDGDLPDPFDGLIAATDDHRVHNVHACMGVPLEIRGDIIGVLAFDAVDPRAFDGLSDEIVATLGALAAGAVHTAVLLDETQRLATRAGEVARTLQRDADTRVGGELLGVSAAMRRVREEVELSAASDLAVLITGETGVGKEVVARNIHAMSARRAAPLIYVNCAALPESIAESELFGHVRGAFTGATETRAGKFEIADGGTLFLDEICELPLSIQPKLLRALQVGEIQRVGSDRLHRVDVRILAATNRVLDDEVAAGRFRADLFHRLQVFPLHVPPLRERQDDILLLAGYFLDAARGRLGLGPTRLGPDARAALERYDFPGNVRELEHVILRAALRASAGRRREGVTVTAEHLALPGGGRGDTRQIDTSARPIDTETPKTLRESVEALERRMVSEALSAAGGNWAEAARRLGVDRANLHRLAKRLGL